MHSFLGVDKAVIHQIQGTRFHCTSIHPQIWFRPNKNLAPKNTNSFLSYPAHQNRMLEKYQTPCVPRYFAIWKKKKKEVAHGTWTGAYTLKKEKKKKLRTGLEPASTPQEKKGPVALPPEPGGTWGTGKCGNLFIRCRDNSLCVIQFGARYLLLGANILGMLLLPLPGRATSLDPSGFLFKMLCILTILLLLLLLAELVRQSASPTRLQIYME